MFQLFVENSDYNPAPADYFNPHTIILTKGWDLTVISRSRAEGICSVYPKATVIDKSDLPHNRVDLEGTDLLSTHYKGKQTLLLGVHNSAVRFSEERENACPNYWHFSPYGFCPYDCKYCYLAGTPGVRYSPAVKIFLNIDKILSQISKAASQLTEPTSFYLGKLQDGLALDSLSGYSKLMIPFFAKQKLTRMVLLTKSSQVNNLLNLEHRGHTILSWSLNPPEVSEIFETNVPSISARIDAMQKCAKAGYPIRAVIMPIIPIDGWQNIYSDFIKSLLESVRLERITLGQICSYSTAMKLTNEKLGPKNDISVKLQNTKSPDGRVRFPADLRISVYEQLIKTITKLQPDIQISLCLEEKKIFSALNMESSIGRCNCVL